MLADDRRQGVHGHDGRVDVEGPEEAGDLAGQVGGGEHDLRRAVGERRGEAARVPGQVRREQRDGDQPGPDGAEEGDDVVGGLRGQHRGPLPRRGEGAQVRGDGADPVVQLAPGEAHRAAVDARAVVQEGHGDLVAEAPGPPAEQGGERIAV